MAFRPAELARQRDFLCCLARELIRDAARAEDVVQDAFVLALERPPREERARAAWLGRVVRRLSLNELRRAGRSAWHERAAARPECDESHAEAEASLDAQHAVLAAVRALEEPYKTTIWLRYYEGLLPAAIAVREGLPVKTVKTRLSRALERLRAELDRASGGDRTAWGALLLPLARPAGLLPLGAGGSGTVLGVLAMKKTVAVLAVLGLAWLAWRAIDPREPGPVAGRSLAASGAESGLARAESPAEEAPPRGSAREPLSSGHEGSGREEAHVGATLVVHALFERDGSDAIGLGLDLVSGTDGRPDLHTLRAQTDVEGCARFEGLASGTSTLHTDRGGVREVELVEGASTELELGIPAGLDVAGEVVDGTGRPVPGAEIWLSRISRSVGDGWLAGAIVARADSLGRFFLRSVGPRQAVGAFAAGFAPAVLEELKEKSWTEEDPRVQLTLVLEREGAFLEGRVVDEQGAPVPDALVALGYAGMSELPRADGRIAHGPTPRTVGSDALGRFRADGLAPGPVPVFVLAEGHALAHVDATASNPAAEPVVVVLARGATIRGRVLDPAGQAIAGAEVRVQRAENLDLVPFQLPHTTSAMDGTFELECVPAGEVTLTARLDADVLRKARATRSLVDATTVTWDLVLEAVPCISGRAVDGAGRGLAHWSILAGSSSRQIGVSLETDEEGRFALPVQDPETVWSLELRRAGVLHDRRENVHAGDTIELAGRGPEELGEVEGGFTDSAQRVPEGAMVLARLGHEDAFYGPSAELVDGRFSFEGITPGHYAVRILSADRVLARSEAFDLAAGAHLDLGLLQSRRAGSLVLELVAPSDAPLNEGGASVWMEGGSQLVLVRRDGQWRADDLDPGSGFLTTEFPGLVMQQRSFEVQEGRETRLSVALERGVQRTLAFVPPPGTSCTSVDVLVRGEALELSLPAFGTEAPTVTMTLAPGTYEIEGTTSSGLSASGSLVIPDLTLASARVAFDLR